MYIWENFYKKLKPKEKTALINNSYINTGFNMLLSMFEYDGLPDEVNQNFVESILLSSVEGCCGFAKIGDQLKYGHLNRYGEIGSDGLGTLGTIITLDNKEYDGTIFDTVIPMYNNHVYSGDFQLFRFSDMLTEVDKSIVCAIDNSRPSIVPIVRDSKMRDAILNTLNTIREGKSDAIVDKNVLDEIESGIQGIRLENITDVSIADKIQYLSKLHDDLIRRIANLYGINITINTKQAQVNTEELSGYDDFASITPLSMLDERKRAIDLINDKFGYNISIKFSRAWDKLNEHPKEEGGTNETDEQADEQTDEPTDESMDESLGDSMDEPETEGSDQ